MAVVAVEADPLRWAVHPRSCGTQELIGWMLPLQTLAWPSLGMQELPRGTWQDPLPSVLPLSLGYKLWGVK